MARRHEAQTLPADSARSSQPNSGLFSVGYEGLTIDAFVRRMIDYGVSTVVDVRLTPASRRPGFSKRALSAALADHAIEYVHEHDLGNPPENRDAFRHGDVELGKTRMRARLENGSGDALLRLVNRARQEPVAVLCVEHAEARCHRQVVTAMACEIEPKLAVRHIW